ncbi:MAG TPA: glyoxalase [Blastocatellia bacterium]|nr:glyoxalase [Blastocatellia bacterium]
MRRAVLLALAVFVLIASAEAAAVKRIESVGFTVSDMDRAIDFYRDVLTFEVESDTEIHGREYELLTGVFGARSRIVRLRLGDEGFELTEFLTPRGRPIPQDSRSNDLWFQHVAIIVSDMDAAYARLRANKVEHASTGPQTLPGYIKPAAGIRAFYFKDPDGHVLEVLEFPPEKGKEKWHRLAKGGRLFLGIDHTAIAVSDTDRSLGFYGEKLGLRVAGESMNYGPEQERLNNVFGARLRITGLATPEEGIAVEFLEYLAPRTGRPYPRGSASNDIWHWQTSFAADDISLLEKMKWEYVSSGAAYMKDSVLGFKRAAVVRDPDGHAVRLTEQGAK